MAPLTTGNTADRLRSGTGTTGWSWRLLIFAFFIFLIVALGYMGVELGYTGFLSSQLQALEEEVSGVTGTIPDADREVLAEFYSRISNLNKLLGTHIVTSRAFPFLERVTHGQVAYDSAELSTKTREFVLTGHAASYEVLSRQLLAYQRAPEVERVLLQNSGLRETTVNFVVRLILSPSLFK